LRRQQHPLVMTVRPVATRKGCAAWSYAGFRLGKEVKVFRGLRLCSRFYLAADIVWCRVAFPLW